MDNPDLIEKYEDELWDKIYQMSKDISYGTTIFILREIIKTINLMDYCKRWLLDARE